MASYKNNSGHKNNSKMKGKYGSEITNRRTSEKPKKEKSVTAPTKVNVRRLPPSMTEEMFIEAVSPLPEHDYFAFINADSSLGANAYSRAYINFKNVDDVYTFRDKFDGYVFVDQKGNEHPAMVEYAPFQKIPKRTGMKKKDPRCGTIDEDADYLGFLETLNKPVTITLPPLEAVLEEIQAQDRELKANNGLIKVKTPLLEFIEQRKAEKLRSKEEKKEERRRKEFERKKAREEDRKKKREIREMHRETRKEQREESHREMKKEQKDDSSVLRPERGKDEYLSEGRPEKSKIEREKERQRREEEKTRLRKEKEKLRREREKEERQRRHDEKPRMREEEKISTREESVEELQDEKHFGWQEEKHFGRKQEVSKSKRYSEGRRKEREKEKVKEEKEIEELEDLEMETLDDESKHSEKVSEKEEKIVEKSSGRKRRDKDPRVERRIRNKDRPAMALYRPGQSRLSSRMRQDREEGAETSSSSPSPVMPSGDPKIPSNQNIKESSNSSRSDSKEESFKAKGSGEDSADSKGTQLEVTEVKNEDEEKSTGYTERNSDFSEDENETVSKEENFRDNVHEIEQETEEDVDEKEQAQLLDDEQENLDEGGAENSSSDVKKYPGVKTMTFRRSVSRE